MNVTELDPVRDTRPGSLLLQLPGTAHSGTARPAEALAELGLSPGGLDLLTELAQARAGLPLAEPGGDDRRDLVVMLERDGLVQSRTDGAAGGRVTIALTSLGAAPQQPGAAALAGASREPARALDGVEGVGPERGPSALRYS